MMIIGLHLTATQGANWQKLKSDGIVKAYKWLKEKKIQGGFQDTKII